MDTETPRRATWREWTGLAVLTLPLLMTATDMTVLFLALPSIAADLAPSSTQLLWTLHLGEFLAVGMVLTMGWLGERIGRRRLLAAAVAVYGAASLSAAFADDPAVLIAARAVMGVAAASLMPSITSLLRVMFTDARQFSVAVAVVMSAFSAGMAVGPPLGGLLLEYFWWGSVFLVNVPVAAVLLLSVPLLPRMPGRRGGGRLDLTSVALSLAAIISVIFGLQEIADRQAAALGAPLWPYAVVVVVGLALGAVFVRRQLRLPDPLLDIRLFAAPAFSVSLGAMLLMLLAAGGVDMLLAQFLQSVLGLSPGRAGLLLIAPAVVSIVGGMLPPLLARWVRPSVIMGGGLLSASAAAAAMVWALERRETVAIVLAAMLLAFSLGPLFTLGYNLIVVSAPLHRTGSATAMGDVAGGFGNALSLALLGSLAAVVYRWGLAGAELSPEVPDAAREAAQESIGGAAAVAEGVPGPAGAELVDAANAAYATAVQAGYGFAAALMFPVGLGVLWLLRKVRLDDADRTGEAPEPESGSGAPVPERGPGAAAPEPGKDGSAPEPARGASVPEPARGASVPEPARGASVPESARGASVPESARGASVPGAFVPEPEPGPSAPVSERGERVCVSDAGPGARE
ncbi:MFS transporter [Nocardiopsis sp. NRRL B-16309]|uniref:MFS transporter n=1 Tax=Nocardiopsis sp. NRRL B-16309 TaxID=1519494 RepID=UPI0009EAD9CC|nr:MFS transporter [Nocardiopsis sp. NRRL B-16309]